jgi:hypothetical protein
MLRAMLRAEGRQAGRPLQGGGAAPGARLCHTLARSGARRLTPGPRAVSLRRRRAAGYFSTPVSTMPCMNWRWAKKNMTAGSKRVSTAVAMARPGYCPKVLTNWPMPTEIG